MIHAGEAYTAMRLDALALSLHRSQVALGDQDRKKAVAALRELRREITDVLPLLEGP